MTGRTSNLYVGRTSELAELRSALLAAQAGRGTTVLVAGEAGIGKTRLILELARVAGDAGFEQLFGHSIELVGAELPFQPFAEALRPIGEPWRAADASPWSQLRVFEETLALLVNHARSAPLLLVLEDLHWADASTLDLVSFLAHHLHDCPIMLLASCRVDEPESARRMSRLADGIRRSTSGLRIELRPLDGADMSSLVATHGVKPLSPAATRAIITRAEGNPFFAEELLAASESPGGRLPDSLRDLLMLRLDRLGLETQGVLRLAAAAGREISFTLLHDTTGLADAELRMTLRESVEHGVLVADQEASRFRFRHALLAEAIYATILPGEREEIHGRLAEGLAGNADVSPGELAPHWAAAGRSTEALVASVAAAAEAEAVFGLTEARSHLERALALWDQVPDASEAARLDLASLCSWAASTASRTGAAPRAVALTERAIELTDESSAALPGLHQALARYLHESGRTGAGLAELERAVALVPAQPPTRERASALAGLGSGLRRAWRFSESLEVSETALALAREVDAPDSTIRALETLGSDLAYLGHADEGLAHLRQALEVSADSGEPEAVLTAYISLTDVLTMLGRPREAARIGKEGLETIRPYAIDSTVLMSNYIEALTASGAWREAERASAESLRSITANFPYMLLMVRADVEVGLGHFDDARSHLDAARTTLREDRGLGVYDVYLAELALWEHRWTDADEAVRRGVALAGSSHAAQIRSWLCAKGLRAQAELVALARARTDSEAVAVWLEQADRLLQTARDAYEQAVAITPNARGWLALAEAEHARVGGAGTPSLWSEAAAAWSRLERTPAVAYCRWREAEALVSDGASRSEAGSRLREAHAIALGLGAQPLLHELELLAGRARLDLTVPNVDPSPEGQGLGAVLGLTPREVEVLDLMSRGCTNREIASALVISVKTAGVHVSHILRKLGASSRVEAATIAHQLATEGPASATHPEMREDG